MFVCVCVCVCVGRGGGSGRIVLLSHDHGKVRCGHSLSRMLNAYSFKRNCL